MIDSQGYLRCDSCRTILGRNLIGRVEIICYRSKCHRNNVFIVPVFEKQERLTPYSVVDRVPA